MLLTSSELVGQDIRHLDRISSVVTDIMTKFLKRRCLYIDFAGIQGGCTLRHFMCRGFFYETSTTCKKEGKIYVKRGILRSITLSRDNNPQKRELKGLLGLLDTQETQETFCAVLPASARVVTG